MRATLVAYGVMVLTVFVDLITAVAVGAFVSNILTIQRLTTIQIGKIRAVTHPGDDAGIKLTDEERHLLDQGRERIMLIQMSGPISYGAARTLAFHMGQNYEVLILDVSDVPFMGVTASLLIDSEVKAAKRRHRRGRIFLVGANGQVIDRLERFQVLQMLPASNVLPDCRTALETALSLLDNDALTATPEPNRQPMAYEPSQEAPW